MNELFLIDRVTNIANITKKMNTYLHKSDEDENRFGGSGSTAFNGLLGLYNAK